VNAKPKILAPTWLQCWQFAVMLRMQAVAERGRKFRAKFRATLDRLAQLGQARAR
jgi:hypothetical protein